MTKHQRILKKVVFGMTEDTIGKVIARHEDRGWKKDSSIKKHGYGLGCQMVWQKNKY
jgi:hypothetical protein